MNNSIEQVEEVQDLVTKKIPRPPNAFMLYANANRKIMAQKYPTESNKDISKRLGASWKSLDVSEKNDYFDKAKTIDAEHKRKYPNYVYNPKEARIRKAMREATRDRAIGASPMLPRPRSRLPPHADWAQSQDEHLMMNPMDGMRRMETPMCSGYTDNNHFLRPMNGYNKVDTSPMMPNYMQPSPLAQLQQQTDMWHPYQDNIMRPRNLGNSYPHTMMPDMQTQSYHTQEPIQETPTNLIMEKSRDSPGCSQQPQQIMSPHQITDENSHHSVVSNINSQKETAQTPPASNNLFMEVKMQQENISTSIMQNTTETENPYTAVNDTMMGYQNELSKETVAVKKIPIVHYPFTNQVYTESKIAEKNLNSADFLSDKYKIDYINKYFMDLPNYSLVTVRTKDGCSFPYASLSTENNNEAADAFLELSRLQSEPQMIPTDVGYLPVLENDLVFDELDSYLNKSNGK